MAESKRIDPTESLNAYKAVNQLVHSGALEAIIERVIADKCYTKEEADNKFAAKAE